MKKNATQGPTSDPNSRPRTLAVDIGGTGIKTIILDPDGKPLTDASRAGDGFLVPIGEYKGYALSLIIGLLAGVLNGGDGPGRIANRSCYCSPHGVFPAAGDDRWVAVACRDDADWQACRQVIGEAWAFDERFEHLAGRLAHQEELDAHLGHWTARRDRAQVARSMHSFNYNPERGRFRDWLGTITRRKINRFLMNEKIGTEGTGGEETAEAIENLIAIEADAGWNIEFNAQILHTALDRIRPFFGAITWQAFAGVWLDNQTAAETATRLNVTLRAVYVAKSKVLRRLEQEVMDLAEDIPVASPKR